MGKAPTTISRTVTVGAGWGYWDLTQYPRGGCFRRLTEDTALVVDTEHQGELYGKLPDGSRICIQGRACLPVVRS
jgi:hypothetical protein